ncbi:MAG: ABC transporter substrate-binding protein [Acidobacteria bacterium]|nr:ABC transporter substrate-binding protein [Acidobacteriota bacterium]
MASILLTLRASQACNLVFLTAMLLATSACSRPASGPVRLTTFQGAVDPYLAQAIGAFRERSLDVQITAVPSTAKAMESLLGGSADVILGTYEQTVQMAAKGKNLAPIAVLDTCHCLALVTLKPGIAQPSDLAGKVIGVAAPGGQMQNFARFLLKGAEASYAAIGVGPASVAALEAGQVDAGVVLYTSFLALKQRHPELKVIAETYTREGMRASLGVDAYASKSVLAEASWIAAHPREAGALKAAFLAGTAWMKAHTPEQIVDQLPPEARGADRNVDLTLLRLLVPLASETGEVPAGADSVARRVLAP